jgi:branched-chain amino acid transport system ATP-binding protein
MSSVDQTRRGAGETPVLSVSNMRKQFDSVTALAGADVEIFEGEIVGIVGPNGAGKSTLFNCICGSIAPTEGEVYLRGEQITGLNTEEIIQQGLSRTFQIPRVFPELTVWDNMVANQDHAGEGLLSTLFRKTDDETRGRIQELLEFVELEPKLEIPAGDLSTGQQKLLNLACTLLRDPDVVLLDEPTAGVNPGLIEDIKSIIVELNDRGWTFLIIEHNMDVVRDITDYVYVLAQGDNLSSGNPAQTLDEPEVLEAYFGE